jgi:hypothetical protein
MPIPAVFRNPRYEARLALAEQRIIALAEMVALQAEALRNLGVFVAYSNDSERLIPPLPEVRGRAFGMGH